MVALTMVFSLRLAAMDKKEQLELAPVIKSIRNSAILLNCNHPLVKSFVDVCNNYSALNIPDIRGLIFGYFCAEKGDEEDDRWIPYKILTATSWWNYFAPIQRLSFNPDNTRLSAVLAPCRENHYVTYRQSPSARPDAVMTWEIESNSCESTGDTKLVLLNISNDVYGKYGAYWYTYYSDAGSTKCRDENNVWCESTDRTLRAIVKRTREMTPNVDAPWDKSKEMTRVTSEEARSITITLEVSKIALLKALFSVKLPTPSWGVCTIQ